MRNNFQQFIPEGGQFTAVSGDPIVGPIIIWYSSPCAVIICNFCVKLESKPQ